MFGVIKIKTVTHISHNHEHLKDRKIYIPIMMIVTIYDTIIIMILEIIRHRKYEVKVDN